MRVGLLSSTQPPKKPSAMRALKRSANYWLNLLSRHRCVTDIGRVCRVISPQEMRQCWADVLSYPRYDATAQNFRSNSPSRGLDRENLQCSPGSYGISANASGQRM